MPAAFFADCPVTSVLLAHLKRISALEGASALLQWDQETLMPPGGASARAEQRAALDGLCHDLFASSETGDLLDGAARELACCDPDAGYVRWAQANVDEARRRLIHAAAVPRDLVEALTRASVRCESRWRQAREENDFAVVRPALDELLALVRVQAGIKADALGVSAYEALLDTFEPGGRTETIDRVFNDLEAFLPDFIDRVIDRQSAEPVPEPLAGPFPRAVQEDVAGGLMRALGFDFDRGRLDTSIHPFCSGGGSDVRITTRYDESDFSAALYGIIHETGHALYEQGLPERWRDQPVGQARSMSFHESQSLFWEMQVGHAPAFLRYAVPVWRRAFGGQGEGWSEAAMLRRLNTVRRSFIRVEADEVTYPIHVILRYRLERAMIGGDLAVADLPGVWNDEMDRLLGRRPLSDREGCLQDIHWYDGLWGYFPTYTLGAMIAAQLFEAAASALPDMEAHLAAGDFAPVLGWLRTHVHARASSMSAEDILIGATGRPLDPAVFKAHLIRRYLGTDPQAGPVR